MTGENDTVAAFAELDGCLLRSHQKVSDEPGAAVENPIHAPGRGGAERKQCE